MPVTTGRNLCMYCGRKCLNRSALISACVGFEPSRQGPTVGRAIVATVLGICASVALFAYVLSGEVDRTTVGWLCIGIGLAIAGLVMTPGIVTWWRTRR